MERGAAEIQAEMLGPAAFRGLSGTYARAWRTANVKLLERMNVANEDLDGDAEYSEYEIACVEKEIARAGAH